MPCPYVIGLTGNIATGKSTIAAMLHALGAEVLDADKLAHEVMRAETEVHRNLVARFGPYILRPDREIDRARLGAIVFADPQALADLDDLVHPAVVQETLDRVAHSSSAVLVVEAIKLLEAGMACFCQAVWVVTTPRAQQVQRLMSTRGLDRAAAEQRIDAQPPPEDKTARADVIIDNSGTLDQAWRQVVAAWNRIPGVAPVPLDRTWPPTRPEDGRCAP